MPCEPKGFRGLGISKGVVLVLEKAFLGAFWTFTTQTTFLVPARICSRSSSPVVFENKVFWGGFTVPRRCGVGPRSAGGRAPQHGRAFAVFEKKCFWGGVSRSPGGAGLVKRASAFAMEGVCCGRQRAW